MKILHLYYCLFTVLLTGCATEKTVTTSVNKPLNGDISLVNQTGILAYWADRDRYVIKYATAETPSKHITFIASDLPKIFQQAGNKVIFSGTYKQNTAFSALNNPTVFTLQLNYIVLSLNQ
jgi:hypothetical protein